MNIPEKFVSRVYNLDQKQQNILGFAVVGLIGFILFTILVPLQIRGLKTLKRQLELQTDHLRTRESKLNSLVQLEKRFTEIQNRVDEREKMFFDPSQARTFLKELNNIAEEAGGQIVLMRPLSEEPLTESRVYEENGLYYIKELVQITYKGEFKALLRLFKEFRKREKLIGIESVKIDTGVQDSDKLSVDFTLALYKLGEKPREKLNETP